MAKKQEERYALQRNRSQPFRRTVKLASGKTKQLVFEPGVDVTLSGSVLDQCQDLIDCGMIVPADRDAKGRLRVRVPGADGDGGDWKEAEELIAENDRLKQELELSSTRHTELLEQIKDEGKASAGEVERLRAELKASQAKNSELEELIAAADSVESEGGKVDEESES